MLAPTRTAGPPRLTKSPLWPRSPLPAPGEVAAAGGGLQGCCAASERRLASRGAGGAFNLRPALATLEDAGGRESRWIRLPGAHLAPRRPAAVLPLAHRWSQDVGGGREGVAPPPPASLAGEEGESLGWAPPKELEARSTEGRGAEGGQRMGNLWARGMALKGPFNITAAKQITNEEPRWIKPTGYQFQVATRSPESFPVA
uniref:Uncharacterized protein n=1 Tax=Sphaerodactylus townsendi TaxID=933632 RepID=A0ACB8EQW0_9SAUR